MGQLPNQGFWSDGSLEHVLRTVIPLLLWGGIVWAAARAVRRGGIRLFAQTAAGPADEPLTQIDDTADPVTPDGRASAYAGFDPAMFGTPPDEAAAEASTSAASGDRDSEP